MSVLRPLPPRASLEYEHKQAKALLRRLRAGDPEAVARGRAQRPSIASPPSRVRLADAQLVIAARIRCRELAATRALVRRRRTSASRAHATSL
jgi:hypothetical protein